MLVPTSPTKDRPTVVAMVAVTHLPSLQIVAADSVLLTNVAVGVVGRLLLILPTDPSAKYVKNLVM